MRVARGQELALRVLPAEGLEKPAAGEKNTAALTDVGARMLAPLTPLRWGGGANSQADQGLLLKGGSHY